MKLKKIFMALVLLTLIMAILACSLPFGAQDNVDEQATAVIEVQNLGWSLYANRGVQIMLPFTYLLGDVEQEIPQLNGILQQLAGSQVGEGLSTFFDGLVEEIVMYGSNQDPTLTEPTRLFIIRNKSFAKLPLSMASIFDPATFGDKLGEITETRLNLAGRDVLRFTAIQGNSAQALYLLKESDRLWIIIFATAPQQFAEELINFEKSVATFQVTSVEE